MLAAPSGLTRILGLDPGLRVTGYGLIEASDRGAVLLEAGVIRTDPRASLEVRLRELHAGVREVLADGRPAAVALEDVFVHDVYPRAAIVMGHACGVIRLAAAEHRLPVDVIPPAAVKRAIVASGRGGKRQIQRMVRVLLGLREEPDPHVGDALAVALVALSRRGVRLATPITGPTAWAPPLRGAGSTSARARTPA